MAAPVAFTVRLQLGEPATGVWCDTCLLPSAATWPVYGLSPGGVFTLGELTACPTCVDITAAVREAVQRVARQLGGTVLDPPRQ